MATMCILVAARHLRCGSMVGSMRLLLAVCTLHFWPLFVFVVRTIEHTATIVQLTVAFAH